MRRIVTLLLLALLLGSGLSVAQNRELVDRNRQPRETVVQVKVRVTDELGRPMPDIMIMAQAVGREAASLTDKSGSCGLELRTGTWVLKAIRLGGAGTLQRREITVGTEKTLDVSLVVPVGGPASSARGSATAPGRGGPRSILGGSAQPAAQISPRDLDRSGAQAATELSLFTDSVLRQARQMIIDQIAANQFSTSYWIDQQEIGSREIPQESSGSGYRLDLDVPGRANTGSRRAGAFESLLSSSNALGGVPVNVTIDAYNDRIRKYLQASDFGLSFSNRDADGRTQGFFPIPRFNISSFTGGSESPENVVGYDLGTSARLRSQGNSTFRAFYNEISNHIVNLYRPIRAAAGQSVIASDAVRGVELGVEKTFIGGLRATVFYSYQEGGSLSIRNVNLHFEDFQDYESFLENGLRHDLQTTIEAGLPGTGTSLQAVYRLNLADADSIAATERANSLFNEHSRIDLSLQQRIDFGILSSARISFSLAVNNLLNSRRNSAIMSTDFEEDASARKLLGGIRIEF